MDTKHISITDVIERLKEFPEEALDWNAPTDMQRIQDFEREFNIELPHEFITLLKETNGFSLEGFEVILGIGKKMVTQLPVVVAAARRDIVVKDVFEVQVHHVVLILEISVEGGAADTCLLHYHLHGYFVEVNLRYKPVEACEYCVERSVYHACTPLA